MNLKTRRRINELEKTLYNALESMYVCDYDDDDHFVAGVEYTLRALWEIGDDDIVPKVKWGDVVELLNDYFDELIRNYYKNYVEECEKSDELTEYPNFVYESVDDLLSDEELTPYAVFEITKPLAYMPIEYYYQEAPLWKTEESIIYIKKGSSGHKSISTKNIKVLKVFPEGETEELHNYLERLRSKVR